MGWDGCYTPACARPAEKVRNCALRWHAISIQFAVGGDVDTTLPRSRSPHNVAYKQARPSAALASQRAQCCWDVCMTMDSAIGSVLPRFRLQRFIGKGISQIVYIRRWEDSPGSTAAPSSAIRPAPIMLQDLPIIFLGTSPKRHLLFSHLFSSLRAI